MIQKKSGINLKSYYTIILETGLIATLSAMLIIVNVDWQSGSDNAVNVNDQEVVKMEEIVQTEQVKTPPPPPKPPVPVEVPNDEVLDDQTFDINAEMDLDSPLDIPAPPEESEAEDEDEVFIVVENRPELKGGMASLQRKVNYPEMARQAGIEGRVVVQFIVNEQGNVVDPKVVRGIGGGCDVEALRVVKTAKFKPGMQRGKPVKVQYTLPINFQLTS